MTLGPHARDLALVAVGGAFGSVLRYSVGRLMGPQADVTIPWHTLAVNVTGAFAIGLLLVIAAKGGWPGWWRPLIAVGVLGGYTTFSTFSLEVVELALHGRIAASAAYAGGSLAAGVAGCAAGIAVGRSL
jgi:CrcB protein